MYSFNNKERWALFGLLLLLLPALLLNLGIVPLYVEEPRRAVVALEMLLRGHWLVPEINGNFYYLKPPVFNWILAVMYKMAGYPSEFISRIPTVISLLMFGLIIFFAGKKYVSTTFGALSAFLFVTAAGNLFFNSLLAEIDIFYSMLTYAGLISMFHLHQRKKYLLLFLVLYFLGAVGTLTKGLPSILFTGLSLLALFIVNREFKKLFSFSHLAGILLYFVIVGGYFLAYSRQGDAVHYLLTLSVESGKRLSGDTFLDYIQHMAFYPVDTLINLLPASLLIIFIFRKSFMDVIRGNIYMKFALLMLIVHFPVYWLPPGGRQRYIIMLYPFIIQVFVYFYLKFYQEEKTRSKVFNNVISVVLGGLAIACLVPVFIERMEFIDNLMLICISSFILMAALFTFQLTRHRYSILALMASMLLLRIFFSQTVLPVRATEGKTPQNRQAALEIAAITKGVQLSIFQPTYLPMQTIFYLERERNAVVPARPQMIPGEFQIIEEIILKNYSYRRETEGHSYNPFHPHSNPFTGNDFNTPGTLSFLTIREFELQKRKYLLIKPV